MRKLVCIPFLFFSIFLSAQDIKLDKGWLFKTGDSPEWSRPTFPDSGWKPIEVGKYWESQGYEGYNGFAWYRIHFVIPSSIREQAFLKEKLRIELGKIDDGDEVFLNGQFLGRNAGSNSNILQGPYDATRIYTLPLNDSRIYWNRENVIAVRVYDSGGDGGMYEGRYGVSAADITDFIVINTNDNTFQFSPDKKVSKKISLQSSSEKYDFTGKLRIDVTDAATGVEIFKQTIGTDFSKNRPFEYTFKTSVPEQKSYLVTYTFDEDRTKKQIIAKETIPYILTPVPAATPRINSPGVFGVQPGSPFLFKIPATGQRPLNFDATGLPAGLTLDKRSGIITGNVSTRGNFKVKLLVKNNVGTASKNITIVCGDNVRLTPALGWNSWNCWGLSVSDEKIRASAKSMAEKLADHGWAYVNIDDGWEDKHNEQGQILTNEKFPDMKALCDYVHGLGLKIGIYSSPGPWTCGHFAGSYKYEEQDAKTYADWGIDYLKYDWCSYGDIAPKQPSLEDFKKPYILMKEALQKNKRDILFSLCQYGMGDVWKWGAEVGASSWRTTGDITDTWESLSTIGFSQDKSAPYTAPGHFNDPDMLIVGKLGWGPKLHDTRLTPDEQYTHISLWSLLSAPLLIGCDMSQLDAFTLSLLTNDEVLAINQDAAAKPAKKVLDNNKIQVWTKELEDGSIAIGIFNLDDTAQKRSVDFSSIKIPASVKLRDVWRQKDLGNFSGSYAAAIPGHGCILIKAVKK